MLHLVAHHKQGILQRFIVPNRAIHGSTFLLLIYCNLAKMDVRTAGGNVKLVNLSSNIGAFVTSLRSGQVFLVLGLIGAVTSIAGHYVGSGLAIKNGSKIVRPTVVIVLILLAVKVVYELITK